MLVRSLRQGIKAKFEAVIALRQAHGFNFGKSDLFFVLALKCALTPHPLLVAFAASTCMLCSCGLAVMRLEACADAAVLRGLLGTRPEPGQGEPTPQEDELVGAKWMPLGDYAAVPFTASRPLFAKIVGKCVDYANGKFAGLKAQRLMAGVNRVKEDLLFYCEPVDEPSSQEGRQNE